MLKKFLSFALTGYVALALFACDDDSNSFQAPEQDPPQVGTESSSSEASEICSSSLETSVESSSSQNSAASSSSESSKVPRYDKLPFDTTGVKPDVYDFVPVDTGAKQETYKYEPIDESYYTSYGENGRRYSRCPSSATSGSISSMSM